MDARSLSPVFDGPAAGAKRMTTARTLGFVIATTAAHLTLTGCTGLLCITCDGALFVEGRVFGIPKLPGTERNSVQLSSTTEVAVPEGSTALQACSVMLEPWSPGLRPTQEAALRRRWHAETDRHGGFRIGGVSKPGTYPATLTVSCDGYRTVESGFVHDRSNQRVTVLMSPQPAR